MRCRGVDAFACEFKNGLFHGPQFGERYAGIWCGEDVGHFAVVITVVAQVDVERGFYFLDVATDGFIVDDTQDAVLAMTEIEVYVRIVAQDGLLVLDVLESRVFSNPVGFPQSVL